MVLLAVGICIKSQGRPVRSCSRCAAGAGGGIGCALPGKKGTLQPSKKNTEIDIQDIFLPVLSFIHTNLFFKNFQRIINFPDLTFYKR